MADYLALEEGTYTTSIWVTTERKALLFIPVSHWSPTGLRGASFYLSRTIFMMEAVQIQYDISALIHAPKPLNAFFSSKSGFLDEVLLRLDGSLILAFWRRSEQLSLSEACFWSSRGLFHFSPQNTCDKRSKRCKSRLH